MDVARMSQVLANIVGNAVKFTPTKGQITVRADLDNDKVVICVNDTGPGIDPGQIVRVFDAHWRAPGAAPGAGLGLSIVRSLVEAHGGEVLIESAIGVGTTVKVRLPQRRHMSESGLLTTQASPQ